MHQEKPFNYRHIDILYYPVKEEDRKKLEDNTKDLKSFLEKEEERILNYLREKYKDININDVKFYRLDHKKIYYCYISLYPIEITLIKLGDRYYIVNPNYRDKDFDTKYKIISMFIDSIPDKNKEVSFINWEELSEKEKDQFLYISDILNFEIIAARVIPYEVNLI